MLIYILYLGSPGNICMTPAWDPKQLKEATLVKSSCMNPGRNPSEGNLEGNPGPLESWRRDARTRILNRKSWRKNLDSLKEDSWENNSQGGILVEETWEWSHVRNHQGGFPGEKSWRRNHGRGTIKEDDLKSILTGEVLEEESLRRNAWGILEE